MGRVASGGSAALSNRSIVCNKWRTTSVSEARDQRSYAVRASPSGMVPPKAMPVRVVVRIADELWGGAD